MSAKFTASAAHTSHARGVLRPVYPRQQPNTKGPFRKAQVVPFWSMARHSTPVEPQQTRYNVAPLILHRPGNIAKNSTNSSRHCPMLFDLRNIRTTSAVGNLAPRIDCLVIIPTHWRQGSGTEAYGCPDAAVYVSAPDIVLYICI
jgi:hypothetical protein